MFKLTIFILLVPAFFVSAAVAYAGAWSDIGFYYPDCRCNWLGWQVWLENTGYRPVKATILVTEYPTYYRDYLTKLVFPGEFVYVGCTADWGWYYDYYYRYTITNACYIR